VNPTPKHVAIIMDGNGRWAKQRGLPRLAGHEQGARAIGACVEGAIESGVYYLTLYAFSSENWSRPRAEVEGLMRLLERFLDEKRGEMCEQGIRLMAIGRLEQLPQATLDKLHSVIAATAGGNRLTVILALSYGGREELVDVAREIAREAAQGRLLPEDIDVDCISRRLYTQGIPDPDLLIRTSGEMRLSNFLLWQLSYTEIHVASKLWPDFKKEDFFAALEDYRGRERRFGRVLVSDLDGLDGLPECEG